MAGREKSGNEILVEQLTLRVSQLLSEQKAKQAIIKELNEQIIIIERESAVRILKAKADTERELAILKVSVAPLESLKLECERLRKDIEALLQRKIDVMSDVKASKGEAIKEADAVLAKSAFRLSKIEAEIMDCKAKVSRL